MTSETEQAAPVLNDEAMASALALKKWLQNDEGWVWNLVDDLWILLRAVGIYADPDPDDLGVSR